MRAEIRRNMACEVLAWIVPALGQIDRANQGALLAELQAAHALAERRLARLRELSGTVPGKEIVFSGHSPFMQQGQGGADQCQCA